MALLQGPSQSDLSKGFVSLIPLGTKILGAYIKDKVLFINFNNTFTLNTLGPEGYQGELKQVIWTVTEFSNIEKVQFLIEGEKHNFLGAEGMNIYNPVGRDNFR
jgi:germination protein M